MHPGNLDLLYRQKASGSLSLVWKENEINWMQLQEITTNCSTSFWRGKSAKHPSDHKPPLIVWERYTSIFFRQLWAAFNHQSYILKLCLVQSLQTNCIGWLKKTVVLVLLKKYFPSEEGCVCVKQSEESLGFTSTEEGDDTEAGSSWEGALCLEHLKGQIGPV